MLLLVHMSWGIGHVSPKYPLQRRLSSGTIETQRFICTKAPRFPCSNYFSVHRVILEHIQEVQKVLSFWKVVLWTVLRLHLQGWHPPHACMLQKTVFPRITLSLVFHHARGISLYTSTWNGSHSFLFHVTLCHQLSRFCLWGVKSSRHAIGMYFSLNICRSQKLM